jgi:uncharacterized membrane protein YbhN (UPF0104 family)
MVYRVAQPAATNRDGLGNRDSGTMASPAMTVQVEPRADRPTSRWSSRGFTVLKVGLSALAIGLVLRTVDLSAAWERIAVQDFRYLMAAVGALMLQIWVGGLRWHVILRRLGAPAKILTSLKLFYIAVFFNTCLWGAVGGDVVRGWLSYRGNVRAGTAVNSIVLDRVAALAGVALLVLASTPYWTARFGHAPVTWVPGVVAAAGLFGILIVAQFDRLPQSWQRLQPMLLLQALGAATRTIFLRPAAAGPTLALAVVAQIMMALTAYFVARSLAIGVSLIDCLVLMQPVALLTSLPISIGGWGVRETAIIAMFGLVGIPASASLVLSVQLGLLTMAVSFPGLVLWFMLKPKHGATVASAT